MTSGPDSPGGGQHIIHRDSDSPDSLGGGAHTVISKAVFYMPEAPLNPSPEDMQMNILVHLVRKYLHPKDAE